MTAVAQRTDVALDVHAVYLSPSGRRCRVLAVQGTKATLLYDCRDGRPAARNEHSDGFSLGFYNWHLLRRVA